MAGESRLVTLCQQRAVTVACWDNAGVKTTILIHPSYGPDGLPIPAGTISTVDGVTDTGFAFTNLDGTPLAATPALADLTAGACPINDVDVEVGCMVNPADSTADPIPVRVVVDSATDPATVTYFSLVDDTEQTPSATLVFEPNCDRFQYVQRTLCVTDGTGAKLAEIVEVRAYDNSDTSDGTASIEPVATVLLDDTGAEYTVPAGATVGDCGGSRPELVYGCLTDASVTPPTYTPVAQVVPFINGVPSIANASYQDPTTGAAVIPAANAVFTPGPCGAPCLTC